MSEERSEYIVSRSYDWAFFLLPPVLSLLLGMLLSGSAFSTRHFLMGQHETTWEAICMGVIIHAHLVAVFFRSHGNRDIFKLYPLRFVVVPLVLWGLLTWSAWVAVASMVVATFWDVWHSGAQTFGLARIYERNRGNPPEAGRLLDFWLNQLLYAGPILAGATMAAHFESFENFEQVQSAMLASVPSFMERTHRYWTWAVLAVGSVFLLVYVLVYARLYRNGHKVSWLKVWLLTSTGFCSIYTWGFNRWGEAFFVMNLFHAVQYLALVWVLEGKRLWGRLSIAKRRFGTAIGVFWFLCFVLAYGTFATVIDVSHRSLWALTMVVSLMHFWYDGFVWSVRKAQV